MPEMPADTPQPTVRTIVRYAWSDRHPKDADLRQAARDSVIRYARHFGLDFRWHHDQYGQRWVSVGGPFLVPELVWGYRSEAIVVERSAR